MIVEITCCPLTASRKTNKGEKDLDGLTRQNGKINQTIGRRPCSLYLVLIEVTRFSLFLSVGCSNIHPNTIHTHSCVKTVLPNGPCVVVVVDISFYRFGDT